LVRGVPYKTTARGLFLYQYGGGIFLIPFPYGRCTPGSGQVGVTHRGPMGAPFYSFLRFCRIVKRKCRIVRVFRGRFEPTFHVVKWPFFLWVCIGQYQPWIGLGMWFGTLAGGKEGELLDMTIFVSADLQKDEAYATHHVDS
jgi:hypothetical protein